PLQGWKSLRQIAGFGRAPALIGVICVICGSFCGFPTLARWAIMVARSSLVPFIASNVSHAPFPPHRLVVVDDRPGARPGGGRRRPGRAGALGHSRMVLPLWRRLPASLRATVP